MTRRRTLFCSTVLAGAAAMVLGASPAAAQTPPSAEGQDVAAPQATQPDDASPTAVDDPSGPQDTAVSEVVVTGSRLRQRDLVANSPIETVSAEELSNAGTLTVETFLNTLPQLSPGISSGGNNPSNNGIATLDLRGLDDVRNLVLIDGRRIVGSDEDNVVDVNIIPAALIQRVEIITGGASAVYGPDAVSGVVNFILRDDFEGVELDVQGMTSGLNDANNMQASLTIGGNFDDGRGNAVLAFTYANREELGKGARPFSAQAGTTTSYFPSGAYRTAANNPSQAAVNAVFGRYGVAAGAVAPNGGGGGFGFNADGTLFATGVANNPAFDVQNFRRDQSEVATNFFPDFFSYNFEPENKLLLPLERQTFSTLVNYDINDRINVYGQAIMANYRADTALAASPAPTSTNPTNGTQEFTIPVTNPFISADLRQLLASRTGDNPALPGSGANEDITYRFRASSLGPRLSSNEISVYNALVGVRLTLPGDWRGDIYGSQGRYVLEEIQDGNLLVRRFEQLLDSPTGGTEFCEGGFNPFGVGLNQACADYVRVLAKNRTLIEQDNVVATFNGPIFSLPAGPVQLAVGAEYRSVDFNLIPDAALQPGEVAGFGSTVPIVGTLHFGEVFGEVAIPLLGDRPLVQSLDLTLGARFTDNNRSGGDFSYKAELSYAVDDALRFRAGYQRAIRSPTVGELFQPLAEDNPLIADPCNVGPSRTAGILALCRQQAINLGFTPAAADALLANYTQSNAQAAALVGGNPDLDPEQADTITVGVVYRPQWQSRFFQAASFSIDYYDIEVVGAINDADAQQVVNRCYESGSVSSLECAQFRRDGGDFGVVDLLTLSGNYGVVQTSGIDFSAGFRVPLDEVFGASWAGTLNVGVLLTWVREFNVQSSTEAPLLDFAGTIGDDYGETLPEYKANFNFGYSTGPFSADLRGRYIDDMPLHRNDVIAGGDDPASSGVDSAVWYWDVAARYAVNDNVEFRVGVLNIFDRDPELYTNDIDSNTDPSTYDVIGRRYFAGINLRF